MSLNRQDSKTKKQSVGELAKTFALRTTSHGISRIAASNTRFRRTVWVVIVLSAFTGYSIHVGTLVIKYLQYDVSMKFDVVTGDYVPFPAVSVCNANKLRLSTIANSTYRDLVKVNEPRFTFVYLGPCMPGDRACDEDNKICIKRYMWCNGNVDCPNAIDELDCMRDNCLPDQYKCNNGKCLPMSLKCNFRDDCGDNSDELFDAGCFIRGCEEGEFKCEETWQCLPINTLCNDQIDCGDGSDEPDYCHLYKIGQCRYDIVYGTGVTQCNGLAVSWTMCPHGTSHVEDNQLCQAGLGGDRTCLPNSDLCDGSVDCVKGGDEHFCQNHYFKCPFGKYKCRTGQCISENARCDGKIDCKDASDELECKEDDVKSHNETWHCSGNESISEYLRCNGYNNCLDGSDEIGCETYDCPNGTLKCAISQICVPLWKKCDGSYDCVLNVNGSLNVTMDTTDEDNCTVEECPVDRYRCNNGQCIDRIKRCDYFANCLDGSDEYNCTQDDCGDGKKLCSKPPAFGEMMSSFCLDEIYWCNEVSDCYNKEDEDGTQCYDYICPPTTYKCTGACKPIEIRCDGISECFARSDESGCENNVCPDGYFRCRSGQCIGQHLYCDEPTKPDCADGSDERYCNATCGDNQYQCKSGWCVNLNLTCDGVNDCGDGSDEINCTLCGQDQFICKGGFDLRQGETIRVTSQCIPMNRVCDRFVNCYFEDDEEGCQYSVYDVTGEDKWNERYQNISANPNIYEDFRSSYFYNRPTDFIPKEYPPLWDYFLVSSNTPDFTDLRQVLRLQKEEVKFFGHQADDLILQCTYDQHECHTSDFYQFQDDVYGNCYTFNHGRNGSDIRTASNYGSEFGLKLTLFTEQSEYISIFGQESGVRLVIHDQNTTPFPKDEGLDARTGTATSIMIKKRSEVRMEPPYGNCTGQAYVNSGSHQYSLLACQKDCLWTTMFDMCGCVDALYLDKPLCDILNKTQDACVQLMHYLYQSGELECNCKQPCRVTEYTKMMSLTSWPSRIYSPRLRSSLLAVNPKTRAIKTDEDVSLNLARVKIYFESLNFEKTTEVKDYPLNQLWADVGGALGLWIGLSLITVVEFLEFVFEVFTKHRVN